jgi:hypothetical protein
MGRTYPSPFAISATYFVSTSGKMPKFVRQKMNLRWRIKTSSFVTPSEEKQIPDRQ